MCKILINNNLEKYKLELYSISGMQSYINIQKAININNHTSKKNKKYHHMIFVKFNTHLGEKVLEN